MVCIGAGAEFYIKEEGNWCARTNGATGTDIEITLLD